MAVSQLTTNTVQADSPAHQIMLWEVTCQFAPSKTFSLLTYLFRGTFKNIPEWEGAFAIAIEISLSNFGKCYWKSISIILVELSGFIATGMCVDTMLPNEDQQCINTEIFDLGL